MLVDGERPREKRQPRHLPCGVTCFLEERHTATAPRAAYGWQWLQRHDSSHVKMFSQVAARVFRRGSRRQRREALRSPGSAHTSALTSGAASTESRRSPDVDTRGWSGGCVSVATSDGRPGSNRELFSRQCSTTTSAAAGHTAPQQHGHGMSADTRKHVPLTCLNCSAHPRTRSFGSARKLCRLRKKEAAKSQVSNLCSRYQTLLDNLKKLKRLSFRRERHARHARSTAASMGKFLG